MKATTLFFALALLLTGCSKVAGDILDKGLSSTQNNSTFTQYTIAQGKQFCDQSGYAPVETSEMKFIAKFDSTAIYQTMLAENQYDINKLFGFSDNNADHHQYSARFGWGWSGHALHLYGYVYNGGLMISKEIKTVSIGTEINCSIRVAGGKYVFTADGTSIEMPRTAITDKAKGYQLYPYFGGDEMAPHAIRIWIRVLATPE